MTPLKAMQSKSVKMWALTWRKTDQLLPCVRTTRRAVIAIVKDEAAPDRWKQTWGVVPVLVTRLK